MLQMQRNWIPAKYFHLILIGSEDSLLEWVPGQEGLISFVNRISRSMEYRGKNGEVVSARKKMKK